MSAFRFNLSSATHLTIGFENTRVVQVSSFFDDPDAVIEIANQKNYTHINPHYPGIRAAVGSDLLSSLCQCVSQLSATQLGGQLLEWEGQAWYSIVTREPRQLTAIQRLPHFDGFDETQLAIMIYLDQTEHGGTAFYRHLSSGFERITQARYPEYKLKLEQDVQRTGLPPAAYMTDGAPLFEKVFESDATRNSMILYPGSNLHSGVIRNDRPLSSDPGLGRLTINGFFRPK
ncbi:MAG: DUF6445 family protein [Pseudomonadota bacterium]